MKKKQREDDGMSSISNNESDISKTDQLIYSILANKQRTNLNKSKPISKDVLLPSRKEARGIRKIPHDETIAVKGDGTTTFSGGSTKKQSRNMYSAPNPTQNPNKEDEDDENDDDDDNEDEGDEDEKEKSEGSDADSRKTNAPDDQEEEEEEEGDEQEQQKSNEDGEEEQQKSNEEEEEEIEKEESSMKRPGMYSSQPPSGLTPEEYAERRELLYEIEEEKQVFGSKFTKDFTIYDDPSDMRYEIERNQMIRDKKGRISSINSNLKLAGGFFNLANHMFGSILQLDNKDNKFIDRWEEAIEKNQEAVHDLERKYCKKGRSSPEWTLIFAFITTVVMTHGKNKYGTAIFGKLFGGGAVGGLKDKKNENNSSINEEEAFSKVSNVSPPLSDDGKGKFDWNAFAQAQGVTSPSSSTPTKDTLPKRKTLKSIDEMNIKTPI